MATDLFDVVDDQQAGPGIILRISTTPGAGQPAIASRDHDALRVRLPMPPQSERANAALRTLVASVFSVDEERVSVVSGISGRQKRLKVADIEKSDAQAALERAIRAANARPGTRS